MKVCYVDNALTPYYNQVLNRLNLEPGIELIVVVPHGVSAHVGDAVYQAKKDLNFKVFELKEITKFCIYSFFEGFNELLYRERPDVIIVGESYIFPFVFDMTLKFAMRRLHIKLMLKSIPFRIPTFEDARKNLSEPIIAFQKLPKPIAEMLYISGFGYFIRYLFLRLLKHVYNLPDGHVDYIDDAYRVFGSYGVSPDKIFITGNSPDTDILFSTRAELSRSMPIITHCEHRLIHIGRLVEWKRVDLLIRALSKVKHEFPCAELLIAGYGPQEPALKALCSELGLEKSVQFLGGVYDPRALGQYLMASSVYVLAGMGGLSINDAMCFGLPIICSVCDGTEKKLVREGYNGKFFIDGDEEDLADKISWMLRNPEARKQMGENSTKIIQEEVNIHMVIKGFKSAFESICGYTHQ